jgi:signal transduction histidine kinase
VAIMTLRRRLVLSAAYLLLVVVVAFEVPIGINIQQRNLAEFRAAALARTAIAAGIIADSLPPASSAGQPGAAHETAGPTVRQVVTQTAAQTGARVVVVDAGGIVVADSSGPADIGTLYATPQRPEFTYALDGHQVTSFTRYSRTLGQDLMVVTVPVWEKGNVVGAVRTSAPLGQVEAKVRRAWLGLAGIGAAIVLAGLALAWVLATSLSKPVRSLASVAARFGAGDVSARATPSGPGEIAGLATSFNHMADEVSDTLAAQREFVANASHQLRTPLTGLRLRLESLEAEGVSPDEVRKALGEVDRLAALVHDLLALEAASLSPTAAGWTDLAQAARDAADRWAEEASRIGFDLVVGGALGVPARASAADVAQILDNLIENSVRYADPPGRIAVEVDVQGERATLRVSDSGPGIDPADRDRAFERFYRGTSGRSAGPGTGLGLAIVGQLVARWGGTVRILEGPGATVEIVLVRAEHQRTTGETDEGPGDERPAFPSADYRFLTQRERSPDVPADTVES